MITLQPPIPDGFKESLMSQISRFILLLRWKPHLLAVIYIQDGRSTSGSGEIDSVLCCYSFVLTSKTGLHSLVPPVFYVRGSQEIKSTVSLWFYFPHQVSLTMIYLKGKESLFRDLVC